MLGKVIVLSEAQEIKALEAIVSVFVTTMFFNDVGILSGCLPPNKYHKVSSFSPSIVSPPINGKTIVSKLLQSLKIEPPMLVTVLGIVTSFNS